MDNLGYIANDKILSVTDIHGYKLVVLQDPERIDQSTGELQQYNHKLLPARYELLWSAEARTDEELQSGYNIIIDELLGIVRDKYGISIFEIDPVFQAVASTIKKEEKLATAILYGNTDPRHT
jgi:hypothetical protein